LPANFRGRSCTSTSTRGPQIEEFDSALSASGTGHEIQVYPGAPHSFFDRKQEEFAKESEDAWRRILGFLARLRERVA
jgi:carboxymethylenebutenolidase